MSFFSYKQRALHAEEVNLVALAKELPTPFYCYSTQILVQAYKSYSASFTGAPVACYYNASANSALAIMRQLHLLGAGVLCNNGFEIERALKAGIEGAKIIFAGVGKTEAEITLALQNGVGLLIAESEGEAKNIAAVAARLHLKAPLGVRVELGVGAHMGKRQPKGPLAPKIGIPLANVRTLCAALLKDKHVEIKAISSHLADEFSQLISFQLASKRLDTLVEIMKAEGHPITMIELGGGFDHCYHKDRKVFEELAGSLAKNLSNSGCDLLLSPGVALVEDAVAMVTKTTLVDKQLRRTVIVLDGHFGNIEDLESQRGELDMQLLEQPAAIGKDKAEVVSRVLGQAQVIAKRQSVAKVQEGDIYAVSRVGANPLTIGAAPIAEGPMAQVLIHGNQYALIGKAGSDSTWANLMPKWL